MYEIRFKDLPVVPDSRADAVYRVAEHLAATIDSDIPGFAVESHGSVSEQLQEANHHRHYELLVGAARLVLPPPDNTVVSRDGAPDMDISFPEVEIGAHVDSSRRRGLESERLALRIRLQTAINAVPARVKMANSAPGTFTFPGDRELFDASLYPLERVVTKQGYEHRRVMLYPNQHLELIEGGYFDPTYMDGDVYSYSQMPGSSVVFRSAASCGPLTVHDFKNAQGFSDERVYLTSDIKVFSQPISDRTTLAA